MIKIKKGWAGFNKLESAAYFNDKYIKWFSEISNKDVSVAGGKGASLGEMYNNKFPVPPGFIITAQAFDFFVENVKEKIKNILIGIDYENTEELSKKSREIRDAIENEEMPDELKSEILESYKILGAEEFGGKGASADALNILRNSQEPIFVSVRSSATTEDLADASFAGQQESFLNIKGDRNLIDNIKKCFSSLYTPRAIYYRNKKGFSEGASLAVVVQKMVDSEKSGVVFSKNPMNLKNNIVIEAVFGLGEGIVSGKIKPDYYVVENSEIKDVQTADKKIAIVRTGSGDNEIIKLSPGKSKSQVLTKQEILEIARYALKLEEHYKKPQDIEFALEDGKVYVVQSRPITTKAREQRHTAISGKIILEGLGASPGISVGVVKIIKSMNDLSKIKKGDVLVTEMTNPDMVVTMQKSAAIITDEGGMTSHASIVSREMGIPAVVGTGNATKILNEGMRVTVDGSEGKIYEGAIAETQLAEVKEIVKTKTKLKIILDLPDFAERAAKSGIDSVGLLRLEGIIANMGKHPLQYERENNLENYTDLLKKGIEKISKFFKLVWIRTSDIRTDEFSSLKGAPQREINPMLGNHGIRFSLKNPEILKAELKAIQEIAEKYPDKKFGVMCPQVILIEEVKQAKKIFNEFKTHNMEFGVMIETPAAVQIIDDICKEVHFVSLGTNDLTQFTLAVDRGEDSVQDLYNELNPAIFSEIKKVLDSCRRYGVKSSICGQAGSKKEMAEFLLKNKIDSISVNADAAYDISVFIKELEETDSLSKDNKKSIIDRQESEISEALQSMKKQNYPKIENKSKNIFIPNKEWFKQWANPDSHHKFAEKVRGIISSVDNTEHLEEKIKKIEEKIEKAKQEKLEENKEVEENIETEINEEKIDSVNSDNIGVYIPEEETATSPAFDYNADEDDEDDKDEISDVF